MRGVSITLCVAASALGLASSARAQPLAVDILLRAADLRSDDANTRNSAIETLLDAPGGKSVLEGHAAALTKQLGVPFFDDRERAQFRLFELGPVAEPALRSATRSGDPEIAMRAKWILNHKETISWYELLASADRLALRRQHDTWAANGGMDLLRTTRRKLLTALAAHRALLEATSEEDVRRAAEVQLRALRRMGGTVSELSEPYYVLGQVHMTALFTPVDSKHDIEVRFGNQSTRFAVRSVPVPLRTLFSKTESIGRWSYWTEFPNGKALATSNSSASGELVGFSLVWSRETPFLESDIFHLPIEPVSAMYTSLLIAFPKSAGGISDAYEQRFRELCERPHRPPQAPHPTAGQV